MPFAPSRFRLSFLLSLAFVLAGRTETALPDEVINDISQLNPIRVRSILTPMSEAEVIAAVKDHRGPISIGGGRFSMGGQTATDGALQIDMRRLNRVVAFSKPNHQITVQAGITWRKLQEYIDPYGLSVQIMQTYDNFTVGGSLSVNVHGRYIGQGPVVLSVESIRLVLANGDVVDASPSEHSELFYGAIGGYGSLGVIVQATLYLADNVRVERQTEVMPLSQYGAYFNRHVRGNPRMIFHNADIYPNALDTVRATSFVETDKPVTIRDRLLPQDQSYGVDRLLFRVVSEWPGGKWVRQHVIDPWLYHRQCVEWRNYEASLDLRELEPSSRVTSTYVLQEYFVPVAQLEPFAAAMRTILRRNHVNVINISIRHAAADPGTLLAWARTEVFAFVLYYKQGTTAADRQAVTGWTQELINAAISDGGRYYLAYQILATPAQFKAAYPDAAALAALKTRVDPENKFRNRLLDAYFTGPAPQQSAR